MAYFVLIGGAGNQVRKKEHNAPRQRVEYKIKIPVFKYFLHPAAHEYFK